MAPQATDDRGVSSFLIFSGLSSGRYVLAILLLMLLKVLRKLPLWCLPHHLSPAADTGHFSHHAAGMVAGFSAGRRNIYLSPPKAAIPQPSGQRPRSPKPLRPAGAVKPRSRRLRQPSCIRDYSHHPPMTLSPITSAGILQPVPPFLSPLSFLPSGKSYRPPR